LNISIESYTDVSKAKWDTYGIKWDQVLDKVEHSLNNTIRRATNETPSRLLFGVDQKGQFSDTIRDLLNPDMNRDLEKIRNKAHEKIEKSQLQNEKWYNLRRKTAHEYEVGDWNPEYQDYTWCKQKAVI